MNLRNKKILASKVLGVGKNKVWFDTSRLNEIKEAITKQDIRDLYEAGAIQIKETPGRRKKEKRKTKRGPGKIKRRINNRKQEYVKITRKLRNYIKQLRIQGKVNREKYREIRKKIKMRVYKSKAHLRESLKDIINTPLEKENQNKKTKTKK
ncbi:MAG: 50S ribosomal protein L19e [Candidatus Nanoarchaeia archaeon]